MAIPHPYVYPAVVLRVVDGDTLYLRIDTGFGNTHTPLKGCRLWGMDTPEVFGVKKGSEEYVEGKKASEFTKEWVAQAGEVVRIRSHALGKYGRPIVEVFREGDAVSLNEALVRAGLAERVDY